ncbi:MAG: type II toxin-antitoxin system RelE/ParE family toxin [Burkholderiales bacterium]|jgi:putative addiction module killer protein|nr:type II toxin-antitoxin system RelE/ParE family toxin [Burkholderiales bacterium]
MLELRRYLMPNGISPYSEWFENLKDNVIKASIRMRLRRVEMGNFGDYSPVGAGVIELRLHLGPGYRIYFGRHGTGVIILLCGGDKSTQAEDIRRAKGMWADWKERQS